jgi:hypothetical protein
LGAKFHEVIGHNVNACGEMKHHEKKEKELKRI